MWHGIQGDSRLFTFAGQVARASPIGALHPSGHAHIGESFTTAVWDSWSSQFKRHRTVLLTGIGPSAWKRKSAVAPGPATVLDIRLVPNLYSKHEEKDKLSQF